MYDVIIIGSGPAGITAGIYIKRAGFNVLVISHNISSLEKTDEIENYYGFENPISGKELYQKGITQAKNLGIEILDKEVTGLKYNEKGYEITIANQGKDEDYVSRYIIIATGANRKKPDIKGISDFEGRGVSYCAVCDGAFYRNKNVAVLGSGDYAIGEMEELVPIVKNVILLTNGEKAPEIRANEIEIECEKINEVRGEKRIEEVVFDNGDSKKIDGLFIAQGTASSIDFAKKIGAKIENNCIFVDDKMETTVPNIFACGDCTGGILQISKAVYQGMVAGLEIIKRLRNK